MDTPAKPFASLAAAWMIGLLAISPFAVALDLWLHFLPDLPVFGYMRSAGTFAQVAWISLGPLGVAAAVLLNRRPILGAVLAALFVSGYVPLANILWRHFTWGCWLALVAVLFAVVGAFAWARSNNSFKPKPLRGSA